ncbi:MAG: hypothetical protein AAB018_00935, partial [Actinomycetota bacterium]
VQDVRAQETLVKPSADLGPTDFNLALDLSGISSRVTTLGALNCTDSGTTYGSIDQMAAVLAFDSRLNTSINMTCRPVVNISRAVQRVSGTMTIPSKGVTDGVIVANCSAKSGISVVANATVGAGIPGIVALNVTSASGPVPYSCDFTASSAAKATGISGTIEGYASVVGMCSSSCVAISLVSTATITSGTGEFQGQTGTGTYTYSDAFEIPGLAGVADQIALLKNTTRVRDERIYCPEGVTDCSKYDPNPCPDKATECTVTETQSVLSVGPQLTQQSLRPSAGRPRSLMHVSLHAGAGDVVILRPMPRTAASVGTLVGGEPITVKSVPKSSCVVTLSNKAKKVSKSVTLAADGTGNITYSTSQLKTIAKSLGLVKRGKVLPKAKVTAACKSTAGKLPV